MPPDLIEDFIAFLYCTQPDKNVCTVCGTEFEEDDGAERCPVCDE
jgi:rubrerythrin